MKRFISALFVAMSFAVMLPAGATGQEAEQSLRPGDALRISVWRNSELSAELVPVGLDGKLVHPLYQEVAVSGVPMGTVRDRLSAFLARYSENPQFSIQPLYRVAVGGEVREPGLLSLPGETTLQQAVALAGGPTERGRLDRVTLVRDGRSIEVDFTDLSNELPRSPIQSGDQVTLGRRRDIFREYIAPGAGVVAALVGIANIFK